MFVRALDIFEYFGGQTDFDTYEIVVNFCSVVVVRVNYFVLLFYISSFLIQNATCPSRYEHNYLIRLY